MDENDWTGAHVIDARGLACPLPVLKARKALAAFAVGARLVVEATDPVAAIDIPHFCAEAGHRLVASERSDGVWRFLIEKGGGDKDAKT